MFQKSNLFKTLPAIILSTLLVAIIIYAWQEPSSAPPSGNVSTPLNISTVTQYKGGALGIGGLFQTDKDTHLAIFSGNVGIGTTTPASKLTVDGGNVDVNGNKVINLAAPTASADAATKGYVDALGSGSLSGTIVLYDSDIVATVIASNYFILANYQLKAPFYLPGATSCSIQVTTCAFSSYENGRIFHRSISASLDGTSIGSATKCLSWSGTATSGLHELSATSEESWSGVSYLAVAYSCN